MNRPQWSTPAKPAIVPDHVIETLLWECRFRDQELAQVLQVRLGQFLHGPAMQTMAELFGRISSPEEVWRIDTLEIDLGVLSADATPEQWADCLAEQLWTSLLRQRQALSGPDWQLALPADTRPGAPVSGAQHDLDLFLFYLQNGHLPWSAHAMAGRDLANWLVRLASRHGPWLWTLLQDLHPTQYVLERLSRIAPHQGLQALIATRHRELADSLLLLDKTLLQPLLTQSRLSAYQMQQLQQAWRVAALHALWGRQSSVLSAERLQRLITALTETLAQQLGPSWRSLLRLDKPGRRKQAGSEPQSELAHTLLESLTGLGWYKTSQALKTEPGRAAALVELALAPARQEAPASKTSQRLQEVALAKLDAALAGSRNLPAGMLLPLIEVLSVRSPLMLQAHLHYHVFQRAERQRWLTRLGPHTVWLLMLQLGDRRQATVAEDEAPESRLAPAQAEAWSESLRQFALAGIKQPAWQGVGGGVSALQAWLLDYTLRQLALGHALPQDHIAWQRLWQQAMDELAPPEQAVSPSVLASDALVLERTPDVKGRGPLSTEAGLAHTEDVRPSPVTGEARKLSPPTMPASSKAPQREVKVPAEQGFTNLSEGWEEGDAWPVLAERYAPALEEIDDLLALPAPHWGPVQRLRLSELLADAALCEVCAVQLPEPRRWQLLALQYPAQVASLRQQSEMLVQATAQLLPKQAPAQLRHSQWRFLLRHCFVAGLPPQPALITRRYALHLRQEDLALQGSRAASLGRWLTRLSAVLEALAHHHAWTAETSWVQKPAALITAMRKGLNRAPSMGEQLEANRPVTAQPAPASAPQAAPARQVEAWAADKKQPSEPIWVGNAGLVLLASYAQRLFAMLGLLDGNQFVDEAAQIKAVHCLAYLCDGHAEGYEADWVLNKLLCGMRLQRPLPQCEGLDEACRTTLDGLLQAVITHWKALGKTSPDGLRQTFLNREARLDTKADQQGWHWRLKVQTGPFDMLLDQLPWSFATIKLPWMEEVLYVDWR